MDSWTWPLSHDYAALGQDFVKPVAPSKVKAPRLLQFNRTLQSELAIAATDEALTAVLSGNCVPEGARPVASVYAGHQFGQFSPRLGDGRAILLGEIRSPWGLQEIQLKGAGITPFSRGGDGRAALGPALREYLMSSAMQALGVPTTRALAVVATGQPVYRETPLLGAIVTRVASSHVRVGTFEYFARTGQHAQVKTLADFVINRHYPELCDDENPYLALLQAVADRQAELIVKWMQYGFIHGVMNTDNTAISGETIDYGPCAFLDAYAPDKRFSYIDQGGRYAYGRQSDIIVWNLSRFAECLLPLIDSDSDKAVAKAQVLLTNVHETIQQKLASAFAAKIGLQGHADGAELAQSLLAIMDKAGADFTLSFRLLALGLKTKDFASWQALFHAAQDERKAAAAWLAKWRYVLMSDEAPEADTAVQMLQLNPAIIPRNHRVEDALTEAHEIVTSGVQALPVMPKFDALFAALQTPFDEAWDNHSLAEAPESRGEGYTTFCGT